jgi:hypothetical protein
MRRVGNSNPPWNRMINKLVFKQLGDVPYWDYFSADDKEALESEIYLGGAGSVKSLA